MPRDSSIHTNIHIGHWHDSIDIYIRMYAYTYIWILIDLILFATCKYFLNMLKPWLVSIVCISLLYWVPFCSVMLIQMQVYDQTSSMNEGSQFVTFHTWLQTKLRCCNLFGKKMFLVLPKKILISLSSPMYNIRICIKRSVFWWLHHFSTIKKWLKRPRRGQKWVSKTIVSPI